jgi:hypothetical protein
LNALVEALYHDGRVLAVIVLSVAVFAAGIRLGTAIRSADSRALALQGAVLSELVANSKCVWYAPADSLGRRPRSR